MCVFLTYALWMLRLPFNFSPRLLPSTHTHTHTHSILSSKSFPLARLWPTLLQLCWPPCCSVSSPVLSCLRALALAFLLLEIILPKQPNGPFLHFLYVSAQGGSNSSQQKHSQSLHCSFLLCSDSLLFRALELYNCMQILYLCVFIFCFCPRL